MQPNNNEFYRGMLSVLHKHAEVPAPVKATPAPAVKVDAAPVAKPTPSVVGSSVSPAQPVAPRVTQFGSAYTPATPGQQTEVYRPLSTNIFKHYGDVTGGSKGWGAVAGKVNDWTGLGNDYAHEAIDQGLQDVKRGLPAQEPSQFDTAFLQNSPSAVKYLQDPNREGSLYDVSKGSTTFNTQTGKFDTDYSKVPGYYMNKFEGWMKDHPWMTGIGGGLLLTTLLGSLMNRGGDEQAQQPQAPVNPQFGQQGFQFPRATAPKFLG